MKKIRFFAGLLTCTMLLQQHVKAQSWTSFYQENLSQRTNGVLPGSAEYISSETVFDPGGDNQIHLVHYTPAGNPINSFQLSETGVDERNVDIVPLNSSQFLNVSYWNKIGSGTIMIRVTMMDISGTILANTLINSTDPQFNSLVAMDATYDPSLNQIIICGAAIKGTTTTRNVPKAAFVTTLDMSLSVLNMHFYNSNAGALQMDDDWATKIVLNNTGRYYIAGSENVRKPTGLNMGIRNMLIDPFTLNIIWSNPLSLYTDPGENSVDMAQDQFGNFITLVNFAQQNTWGIIRVDPSSGASISPQIENSGEWGEYGHTIAYGNAPNELVVEGMKHKTQIPCSQYINDADPFFATLDVNPYPANLIMKNEYLTIIGTQNGGLDYWTLGDVYSPQASSYPVPVYANQFADRKGPASNYCALAPILDPSSTLLNTKSIFVDPATNTACPMSQCLNPLQTVYNVLVPYTILNDYPTSVSQPGSGPTSYNFPWYGIKDCAGGYYKTTSVSETELAASDVKISPNPAVNSFNISLSDSYKNKKTQIVLCDVSGKKIATIFDGVNTNDKITYDVPSSVVNGMYFVQIVSDGNTTKTEKIVLDK